MLLDSHYFFERTKEFFYSDNGLIDDMDSNLYFSQMAGVDRATMGTAMEADDSGNMVRRSTREKIQ